MGDGLDQATARRRAKELGGIAISARKGLTGKWNTGGWGKPGVWIVVSLDRHAVLDDGGQPARGTALSTATGRCHSCGHPRDDHAEDGCQAPVSIDGDGPYDCNCQEREAW